MAVALSAWSAIPRRADSAVVTLRPEQQFQTIHSFAASDAWSVQFLGHHWPAAQRRRAADLLFSTEDHRDGSPVGIGLSAWRFEIGGGSAAPGDSSRINDRWRRATGFLRRDGSYDWSQQPGQRAFMREAKARGVERFIGFVNSPPTALTRNGRANSSGGDSANLSPARYGDYAADVGCHAASDVVSVRCEPARRPSTVVRGAAALTASYLPARRAAAIRPVRALRAQ